jgi:hypothetical protein
MCDIYSNAHLVISADASPSSEFGFLPGRDNKENPFTRIEVHDDPRRPLVASARTHRKHSRVTFDGQPWNGTSLSPLLGRGWALQESILANRLLRFTVHGLEYECNHNSPNQLSLVSRAIRVAKLRRHYPALAIQRNEIKEIYDSEDPETSIHITDLLRENTPDAVYHAWQTIVTTYFIVTWPG